MNCEIPFKKLSEKHRMWYNITMMGIMKKYPVVPIKPPKDFEVVRVSKL